MLFSSRSLSPIVEDSQRGLLLQGVCIVCIIMAVLGADCSLSTSRCVLFIRWPFIRAGIVYRYWVSLMRKGDFCCPRCGCLGPNTFFGHKCSYSLGLNECRGSNLEVGFSWSSVLSAENSSRVGWRTLLGQFFSLAKAFSYKFSFPLKQCSSSICFCSHFTKNFVIEFSALGSLYVIYIYILKFIIYSYLIQ